MTRREQFQLDLPALRAQRETPPPGIASNGGAARGAKRWFAFRGGDRPTPRPRQIAVNLKRRLAIVLMILALAGTALIVRAIDLQWVSKDFYLDQGDQRYVRDLKIDAPRGTIFDRNGNPLAVSTPVASIWADPSALKEHLDRIPELAKALNLDADALAQKIVQRAGNKQQFVYLVRQLNPDAADEILKLGIPGVDKQPEFRRFYPNGEVTAHILGKTNIDDVGAEGLELAFNEALTGKPGSKSVIIDLHKRAVESYDVDLDVPPQPGRDLTLSIDKNIQYLAYRELMAAIKDHKAAYGSIVVMDVTNGEILAMVNHPSFNPNSQNLNISPKDLLDHMRNRAATDVVEPGSTMKAVTISAALESGKWKPDSKVDTNPGTWQHYDHIVHDHRNVGLLTVTGVITHSSNVGAAKIASTLSRDQMWDVFHRFGFGETTGSGFTGESPGNLPIAKRWGPVEQDTIAYGYGLSLTPLQLARAYAAIANGGILYEPTFVKDGGGHGKRIIDQKIAGQVAAMLRTVVAADSTAPKAAVPNYFAGGKTGTSHIADKGGYRNVYNSVFVGFVPATNPRLVAAIVISGATGTDIVQYMGGTVAAPAFSTVMQGALRLLDIPPDNVKNWYAGGPGPDPLALPMLPPEPPADPAAVGEIETDEP